MNEMAQLEEVLPAKDQTEFYKDQLKRVIANIRKDYEQLHEEQKREIEEWMHIKTEEFSIKSADNQALNEMEMDIHMENIQTLRNEFDLNNQELENLKAHNNQLTKRLHANENVIENEKLSLNETLYAQDKEKDKLNDDLDSLVNDYNHLNATKRSLEKEIQVYKNLLNTQLETHVPIQCVSTTIQSVQPVTTSLALCHSSAKAPVDPKNDNTFEGQVVNKKMKKCAIGICDSSPDGKNITIENAGPSSHFIDLTGWVIRRKVDSGSELIYVLPAGACIHPNTELTIWGNSYKQLRRNDDLVTDFENWGFGINSWSSLITPSGEEVSSFHQQFTFSEFY